MAEVYDIEGAFCVLLRNDGGTFVDISEAAGIQVRSPSGTPVAKALGVAPYDVDGDGLPFQVRGAGSVAGGAVEIDASASSQFVSGLLLAGASFTDGLTVQHVGQALPSAPHIAMTVAMLPSANAACCGCRISLTFSIWPKS